MALPILVVLGASAAVAAVVVEYDDASTAALELKAPPVLWAAGPDSSGNAFVSSWSLSPNATHWSITLRAVPEATVTWQNLTTLANTASESYGVLVTGTDLSGYDKVLVARLAFYEYGTDALVGTLDLKSGASLNLGTVPAGQHFSVRGTVQLDEGTGAQDLPSSVTIGLGITP